MAEIAWTEPAVADLDAIADYIALDMPDAARQLVRRVFDHVEQFAAHPDSGSKPSELKGWRYRQLVEPPCRIFHRHNRGHVYILHVMRAEQRLRKERLTRSAGARPKKAR